MNQALQRLGLTRSGKVIYQSIDINHELFGGFTSAFTQADHFDAYALFQFLIARELRRNGRWSKVINDYSDLASFHELELTSDTVVAEMRSLSLATIFDIAKYGRSLSDHIFHD
jgi:hypothetical protein